MSARYATFQPGWLQAQVRKSVALLDQLPPKLRASLVQPTNRKPYTDNMCRNPDIIALDPVLVTWLNEDGLPVLENYIPRRCENCDRWAHECPICKEIRCDSDLHMSMVGTIPLACKVCRPNGISQVFHMDHGEGVGPYRSGGELVIDDPDIDGFRLT